MTTPFRQLKTVLLLAVVTAPSLAQAADLDRDQLQFFESKIRPVLAEHCYECHSVNAKKLKGELLLDSPWGWQQGGESGAVIVPGKPEESLILRALQYEKFEMPPKGRLPASVVADFREWITRGAPDPRPRTTRPEKEAAFDLEKRRKWWSLQPVQQVPPPPVKAKDWPRTDYDHFILARLEQKGWKPAPPAARQSWLRRVTFDLTGLPPTPAELSGFLADNSEGAHENVVDRLLSSPHFGEQWARHWMDLVRYAETKAFEADYPMPNAFEYRDYLIRAFNDDVPYNQFVMEGIAGDLINPRINPRTGINESIIGPGYLYLTDGQHGPPDIHADEARIFDDMIDVIGKVYQGQTVACARCHDHKFDAITTRDYYSLYGLIASSRIDYADINPPQRQERDRQSLRAGKARLREALADLLKEDLQTARDDLRAVRDDAPATPLQKRWADALRKNPNEVTRTLSTLLTARDQAALQSAWKALQAEPRQASLGKLTRTSFGDWIASGISFETTPTAPGDFIVAAEGENAVSSFASGRPAAGHLSSRFAGSIKSPTFNIAGDSVSVRVKGRNLRVSLYVRHYELVGRGPTTGGTTKVINNDTWETVRFATQLWHGETAYIEVQHNGGEVNFDWQTGKHVDGAYAVLDSAANNTPLPPPPPAGPAWGVAGDPPGTPEALLDHLSTQLNGLTEHWRTGELTMAQGDLLEGLFEAGILDFSIARSQPLKRAIERYRKDQNDLAPPTYVRTLSDGHGQDEPVYIRGSHTNPSPQPNPRHFLDGIDSTPFGTAGSGRREWAEALVSNKNPLTARVMSNRIWHHLFGRGIVASVDDFGRMGDTPSHPELLDFLARKFVENGWSIKSLIRELVLSSTYRMSSEGASDALNSDPANVFLQHMPVRRLQAEAVRDTLLAVSGELDPTLFGPSVQGGGNRRSIYVQLRRRYMPEFLMTFDMPNATEPFGRRNVTAGPAQSLAMLNGSQVWRAAEKWAQRVLNEGTAQTFEERIDLMHRQAFSRAASDHELEWARGLLADVQGSGSASWMEICHTMLNRKELIYVY